MFWRFPHFASGLRFVKRRVGAAHKGTSEVRTGMSCDRHGFSLIEVVLAVGITAFILISVFGMTAVAVKGTREADINSRLTQIGRLEASLSQMEHFSKYVGSLPTTNYYNQESAPVDASASDIYYRCDLVNVTPPGTSTNLVLVQLQVRWPVPQLAFTNTTILSLAKYD